LLDLLLGFHQPQRGAVLVDGVSLRDLDLASWRSRIGVVNQDAYIFDDTVKANILYGRLEASDDDVIAAARLACADDFINELAQGYDTVVGDRGTQVSGGQRQRLALARALIRDPHILILDEATNALDAVTERAFQDALKRFARDRTVIIVAHRLTMIDNVDQVIVIDDGSIVEAGEPHTLLRADGLFARMCRFQHPRPPAGTADSAASVVGLADRPRTASRPDPSPDRGGDGT
jgi:subfamily B ATP-binding cassette protein MsbA